MSKLTSQIFTTSGTWTAPAGVTNIYLLGSGGGQGGGGGYNGTFFNASGGIGFIPYLRTIVIVPNTTYTITIGAGGAGGAGGAAAGFGVSGSFGASTTFGALATFSGSSSLGWVSTGGAPTPQVNSSYILQTSTVGSDSGNYRGGLFGAPGVGVGGNGGNGNNSGTGVAGSGGVDGSGGGAGGAGSTAGGAGGAGGSGILTILWVE